MKSNQLNSVFRGFETFLLALPYKHINNQLKRVKMKNNALNIQDYIHYWESNHGEQRAGHFNVELYLSILAIKNNL